MEDFFAPAVTPARPAPVAPQRAAPRRRLPRHVWTASALGVLTSTVLLTTVLADDAPPELRQVREPAPASEGWGPSWVDALGRPGRWDPCTPIAYVVNPAHAPQSARADLAEALRRLTAVSGLQFADAGDTDEPPRRDRPAYQPERYGERWAPLLVAWSPPAATDVGVGGGTKGVALTVAVPGAGGPSILTAQVVLDADLRLPSGFGPGTTEGEVLQHELAHAVGLGHVDDPTQVMYWRTTHSESEFGAGDRAGLAALGAAAGCLPAPRPGPLDAES